MRRPGRAGRSAPHALRSIDLVHGRPHFHVWLDVCDQRLDDHEAEGRHGLGQLLLNVVRNLLFGLKGTSKASTAP